MPHPELDVSDCIEWRGLRLERRKEYPQERYDHVALGGAFWIAERLDRSLGKAWIAWLIIGDCMRLMCPGDTAIQALDGVHVDAIKLDEQLHGALLEIRHQEWRSGDQRGRVG